MANQPDRDDTKQRSIFVTAAIGGLLVIVIVLAAALVFSNRDGDPTSDPTGGGDPSGSTTTDAAVPDGFVTLPAPTKSENGYPVGYPQTPEGAAALVAAFEVAAATALEYDSGTGVANAYLYSNAAEVTREEFANGIVTANRQDLGIPLNGKVPPGPAVDMTIEGIKWKDQGSGRVLVSYLFSAQLTNLDGTAATRTGAAAIPAVWAEGRWWTDPAGPGATELDYAAPGSAAYADAGWQIIKDDAWRGTLL